MINEIFTIHIQIGSFRFPLKIARKDEELYRKAEKLVERYMDLYQKDYRQRPNEEILILVAYQIAVLFSKHKLSEDIVPLADKIQLLDKELEAVLNNKNL